MPSEREANVGGEVVRLVESLGVIFPEGYYTPADDELFPYWTPTQEVVAEAEARLPSFLRDAPPEWAEDWQRRTHLYAPLILHQLPHYRRQYWGIVFGGLPALYINCFLDEGGRFDFWLASPVRVWDGGHAYFQLIYRPNERDFVRFYVNGEA